MTYSIRLVLQKKGLLAEKQDIKVRQRAKGAPKTKLEMFARSKQTFENGAPSRAITLTELHSEGKDVVDGLLVEDKTLRKYNQFDYTLIKKDIDGNILPKKEQHYDYSKKLTPKRYPLDTIKSINQFEDDLDSVVPLIRKAILSKFSRQRIYSMFVKFREEKEKNQKELDWLQKYKPDDTKISILTKKVNKRFELNLRCLVLVIQDGFNKEGIKLPNIGFNMPAIHIKKAFKSEKVRLVPDYEDIIKESKKTIDHSFSLPDGFQGSIPINGKEIPLNNAREVTFKTPFTNLQPLMVDEFIYDFFIDANTIRKVKEEIIKVKYAIDMQNQIHNI